MGIRDDEIKRLLDYCKSLSIQVIWDNKLVDAGASWDNINKDQAEIRLRKDTGNKTLTILYLLHELAHHLAWVYDNRKLSAEITDALRQDEPKTYQARKLIYEMEKSDATYRLNIVKELNIKISESKILVDIELDNWIYYEYWQNGKFPPLYQIINKKKEIKEKFKWARK
jgi:hypothetical protein